MVKVNMNDEVIKSTYYDLGNPGGFGSINKLYLSVKKKIPNITQKEIREWLKGEELYSVHYPFKSVMPRSRVIVKGIDYMWDADLMDMSLLSKYNNKVKYVLLVIDVFSKYVWTYPLEVKTGEMVVGSLKEIFNVTKRKPVYIRTDKGTEFVNTVVKDFLKATDVKHIVTQSETKASIAERAIKTIKGKLYKYMYWKQTYTYLNVLDDVTKTYNNTYHSTIKMSPVQVNTKNERKLWWDMYVSDVKVTTLQYDKRNVSLLKKGDYVRISFLRMTFAREYRQKWSPEIFQIYQRYSRDGIYVYWLRDLGGEPILGSFYREELLPVKFDTNTVYKIEKVIKTKKDKKGKKLYYVKWLNWGDKFNSWVKEKDFVSL